MHSHTYTRLHAPTRTYAKSSKHMYNQATRLYRRYGLTPSSHTYTYIVFAWQMAPARMPKHSPGARLPLSGYQHAGNRVSERVEDWVIFLSCCFQGSFYRQWIEFWRKTQHRLPLCLQKKKCFRRRITQRHHFNKLFVKPETRSFLCGNNSLAMHLVVLPHYPARAENIRRRLFFRAIGLAWWAFFPTPSLSP